MSITDLWGSTDSDFSGTVSSGSSFSPSVGGAVGAIGSIFQGISGNIAAQGQASADRSTAAGDLATAQGYEAESQAYSEAAGYAAGNVTLAEESKAIQQYQQQRSLSLSLGRTRAQLAGAGLTSGGSGLDILRASAAQGALAKGLIGVQGEIQAQGYRAQSAADTLLSEQATDAATSAQDAAAAARTQASAASKAGTISLIGGIVGGIGKIFGL